MSLSGGVIFGQEYKIQIGDKLNITFWQEPDLNTLATVSPEGTIELPIVGKLKAVGLTPSELSKRIVDQISRFRINVTQASVVVLEYQGNKVYVTGHVGSPGPYSFPVIPNLWKILQEAGGLLESADLEHITIIRGGEQQGKIVEVDLTKYLEQGKISELPPVYGGDTIHVPGLPQTSTSSPMASPFIPKNEIYIVGEVASPGRYNFEKNLTLLDALILAGGPTPAAKLSDVKIIKRWSDKSGLVKINLKEYLNNAEPEVLLLEAGDTIYVPKKANVASFVFSRVLLPVATSAAVFLIVDVLRR